VAASVVCISQTTGSGGEEVGRAVARSLGYRYVDEEIVASAAARQGLDPEVVADAERHKSFLTRWLDELRDSPGLDVHSGYGVLAYADESATETRPEALRTLIRDAVRDAADAGRAVIVSHAASIALAGRDGLLRVLVTASPEIRARRLAEGPLDLDEATKAIGKADAARADYLARFYDVDRETPTHYDLVVSTDTLDLHDVAGLIVHAAGLGGR
jgi:cytidylate kinase